MDAVSKILTATASLGALALSLKLTHSYFSVESNDLDRFLLELQDQFAVNEEKLALITKCLYESMDIGLKKDDATIRMLPSFVTKQPDGEERGSFLALDLGGTNFRVCEVTLKGEGDYDVKQKKYRMSDEVKEGKGEDLFGFVGDCVDEFLKENKIKTSWTDPTRMGFTFSWPVQQTAIDQGTLIQWNKGVNCSGVVGEDVVSLLQHAFESRNIHINVVALVNDTVGTLMAHAYKDPKTRIGVILGTGSNAAYFESTKNIAKASFDSELMVINTEWGNFDQEKRCLSSTQYDQIVDHSSVNQGKQLFEKMISGMYLGEITRLIIIEMVDEKLLFRKNMCGALREPYSFDTSLMSRIERDTSSFSDTRKIFKESFHIPIMSEQECQAIKRICYLVGLRSARLSAAALAGILKRLDNSLQNGCTVAIDGSLFENYPDFEFKMKKALKEIFGISAEGIILSLAKDGSGVGAAVIAAASS